MLVRSEPQDSAKPEELERTFSSKVWRIVRTLLVAYLLVCLLMVCLESSLVYPIPTPRSSPAAEELGFEDVQFQSLDGTFLHGWYYPHENARIGLLYCHGNGEDVTRNADLVHWFHDKLSASVFIFDYRGYGNSEGTPHEAGVIADGLAAQQWLAARLGVATDQIVLVGRSLGGAVAVALAKQQGAHAIVLLNTFPDMTEVAASKYPWLPVRWLMRNRYPSIERIQAYTGPLLQSHGTADRIVPFALAKELYDASPSEQKRFVEIQGGSHNDPMSDSLNKAMIEFLALLDPAS